MRGRLDVELGARHGGAVVDGALGSPQVDAADHESILGVRRLRPRLEYSTWNAGAESRAPRPCSIAETHVVCLTRSLGAIVRWRAR
jgi:hypothetical protein